MIMLRNIYTGENICAFDNETDAFEMVMSLVEECACDTFYIHLNYGNTIENAYEHAKNDADDYIEGLYFQKIPYVQSDFPHIKEDD